MLVAYEPSKERMFSFWSLPDIHYLFCAGAKGHAGNEFVRLEKTPGVTEDGFRVFDTATKRLKRISVDKTGRFEVADCGSPIPTDETVNRFLFLGNTERYLFVPEGESDELCVINAEGKRNGTGAYPSSLNPIKDAPLLFTYNKLVVAKPDGTRFAAFYAYMKVCRIYDNKGRLCMETKIGNIDPNAAIDGKQVYATQPVATDNRILILTKEEDGQTVCEEWNWDGELIARYGLNKPITCMAFHNGIIFGIQRNTENKIYTFKLHDYAR